MYYIIIMPMGRMYKVSGGRTHRVRLLRARPVYRRRQRGRRGRVLSRIQRPMPGFPQTRVVNMRYCDTIQLNPGTAGAIDIHEFRANSIFDPDKTGTGHQPIGHDEWAAFYNHYVVLGAKITLALVPSSNSESANPDLVGVYLTDDSTGSNDPVALIEQGRCKYTLVGKVQQDGVARKLINTYSAKKFFNLSNVNDNVTRIGATTDASPAEEAIFRCFAGNTFADNTGPTSILVTIQYSVMFSEPRELVQS